MFRPFNLLFVTFITFSWLSFQANAQESSTGTNQEDALRSPLTEASVNQPPEVASTIIELCDAENNSASCMTYRHWWNSDFTLERTIRKNKANESCLVMDTVKFNEKSKIVKFSMGCNQLSQPPQKTWLRSLEPWLGKMIDPSQ